MRLDVENLPAAPPTPFSENADPGDTAQAASEALNMGIRHAQNGDRVNARVALLRAAELDDRNVNSWLWLASISEYPEELMVFLDKVLAIDPFNERAVQWMSATKALLSKTFLQRGSDAAEAGQRTYAEDCFRKALEYDRKCIEAWLWCARLSSSDSDRIAYFERSLEIDPNNEEARSGLETIRSEKEKTAFAAIKRSVLEGGEQQVLESLSEFNDKYPSNVEAWMLRSHLAVKPVDKLNALERVLELDPDNEAAKVSHHSLSSMFAPLQDEPLAVESTQEPEKQYEEVKVLKVENEDENDFEAPIAPPSEALVFEPIEPDFEIPDTIFVGADESAEIRDSVEGAELDDWNRDTESYDVVIGPEDIKVSEVNDAKMVEAFEAPPAIPMPAETPVADNPAERTGFETTVEKPKSKNKKTQICAFCHAANDDIAFSCSSCRAVLSLSDLELLLANNNADKHVIRKAVDKMEAERNIQPFDQPQLTVLGIGHLNLRNLQFGYDRLQEASKLDPDNIVLAGQVNALLIRIDEIRRQEEAHAALVKGKTILVVDDSATVRKLIAGKLEKSGHTVHCSSDGEDALEQIKTTVPDLVLLDIAMPGMDGYQVCRQIRGWVATANVPVVMISGKDGFFDKMRGKMAGAVGHITKPFGPETLMKAVEFYLGGGVDLETEPQVLETELVN
jgi:twitching motility two-component system response regulator PilG